MEWSFCPQCGHRVYQHAGPAHDAAKWDGGCTHVETIGHVLHVTGNKWTLKHPVRERDADQLFNCAVHQQVSEEIGIELVVGGRRGEFAVVENPDRPGHLMLADASVAREQCPCTVRYADLFARRA